MPPTSNPSEPEFLKVEEVAARLKVKDKTVRDWIARGELESYKDRQGVAHPTRPLRRSDRSSPRQCPARW
jgi:excisionase family DNA binding protein